MVAILAAQLSIEDINSIMKERDGLGESGETYLVGPEGLMRSDSYIDPKNHSVESSFRNPNKGTVNTLSVIKALKNEKAALATPFAFSRQHCDTTESDCFAERSSI